MDQYESTIAEQFQITQVRCNNPQHQGEEIQSLCLRVGCKHPSAQCCKCTKEFHKDCHDFNQSLTNIAELVIPLQRVRSKLFQLQHNMNSYMETLIEQIDESLKPINQYSDYPNLNKLNKLGTFLKQEIEATILQELDKVEQMIKPQFQQCKENLLSTCYNEIDFRVFEIKVKEFCEENQAEQALAIIGAAKLKYQDNYCLEYLEGFNCYQTAIECLNRAIEIDPSCIDAKIVRMNAIKEIDRIIEKKEKLGDSTNYKSYEQLGIYYRNTISRYKLNQLVYVQEAIDFYDKQIQTNENNYFAWFNKGSALFAMKSYLESIDCYDKVLRIYPDCFDAWKEKGYALFSLKRYSEAIFQFEHALNLNPNHSTANYGWEIANIELDK